MAHFFRFVTPKTAVFLLKHLSGKAGFPLLLPLCLYAFLYSCPVIDEGEQNMPPQNVPPWHAGYFELKTTVSQKTLEELFNSHLTA